ncbi:DNA-deoxyinosine glycosylase [Paracandidimonas soli]|uniref:G/U mismatch-specific uracil-DNA glycosylase n=1 Tax=Paracandidimonas soli TaxID=1917182 RepID=A0A4R3UQ17_9BURK|nr:DNA-deoxyinosine glycosylase [Paracandidimonas soli]TCU93906.1 G/U mismatch-specific uracil-DNA glycosylase [Paracandidimonas soli]
MRSSSRSDVPEAASFPPVVGHDPGILVLGSMPGVRSLERQQYYAHPRNAFWPVMAEVFGFDAALPYEARLAQLAAHGVALWDVLAQCRRPGSLDAAIERDSIVCNDFSAFLARHGGIRRICFNGATAEQLFRRHALPGLAERQLPELVRLPSTSPAHAGMVFEEKLRQWRAALAV